MNLNFQLPPTSTVFGRDPQWVLSFDREGRLLTWVRGAELFKRALDSRLFARHRHAGQRWRRLDEDERRAVFGAAYELAAATAGDPAVPAELRARLADEVLPWTVERLLAESDRCARAYLPIPILPPDQYLAIVVQATHGCTWNRCTFCSFYQGRPFHAASPEELARHVAAVRDLLGRDLARRRGIFLADGNALALGRRRLLPLLEVARAGFPGQPLASFVDVYSGERHDPADWHELAGLGLRQVYVGMETGLDELLRLVDKPGSAAELTTFVAELKAAAIGVSLILMVGLGGVEFRERHRAASLETLAALPLDRGDLVYLSPFVEESGSLYAERRAAAGLTPMSAAAIDAEIAEWTAVLRASGRRVGRYDIRELVY